MNIFPVHPPTYSEPPTSKNLGGTLAVAVMKKTGPTTPLFQLCLRARDSDFINSSPIEKVMD